MKSDRRICIEAQEEIELLAANNVHPEVAQAAAVVPAHD
jgi:hypothetical protein